MEIYIMDVRAFADETLSEKGFRFLLPERRAQLGRLRRETDRWRCMGAGLLLEYGMRQRGCTLFADGGDKTPVTLENGAHGKPYPATGGHFSFNLSHSGHYAAAVFADTSVGIDVEAVRPAKLALAKRFFRQEETVYLQEICEREGSARADVAFTRLWTRKESYIKAVGEGIRLPLADFSVLSDTLADSGYRLRTWTLPDGYVLTVCAQSPIEDQVQRLCARDAQFWHALGI